VLKRKYLAHGLFSLAVLSASYTGLASANTKLIEQGKVLFNQTCQACHQADAIGKPGFAPSLTNKELLSLASDKFLMSTIRDGRTGTGMPPMAFLGKQKISAIVAYLKSHASLPNRSAQVDAEPDSFGDSRKGELWFQQICASCHGTEGQGYAAGVVGTAIGKPGFLNKASDGFIRETVKHGRSNTRMRGFSGSGGLANLRDSEINDIIVYLRTLNK
jgi:cbb3-type cytochrome c oxidase subunit III